MMKDLMDKFYSILDLARKVALALFILSLCSPGLWDRGCMAKNGPPIVNQAQASAKKIALFQKRLNKLLAPVVYRYSPAGKPDPFRPFFRTATSARRVPAKTAKKSKKATKCSTPLECMDVGQLTLVGIVREGNGQAIAMAQDASGIGYTLKPGMRIGFQKGKIVAIEREKVIVREQVEDIKGKLQYRDRILYLHPEESDEAD